MAAHGEQDLFPIARKRVGSPDGLDERIHVRIVERPGPSPNERQGTNEAVRIILPVQLPLTVHAFLVEQRRNHDARRAARSSENDGRCYLKPLSKFGKKSCTTAGMSEIARRSGHSSRFTRSLVSCRDFSSPQRKTAAG